MKLSDDHRRQLRYMAMALADERIAAMGDDDVLSPAEMGFEVRAALWLHADDTAAWLFRGLIRAKGEDAL